MEKDRERDIEKEIDELDFVAMRVNALAVNKISPLVYQTIDKILTTMQIIHDSREKLKSQLRTTQQQVGEMRTILGYAKIKLALYREKSGEYLGGLEYTQLIKLIDSALAQNEGVKQ